MCGGDRQPVDRARPCRAAVEGVESGGDRQVGGDAGLAVTAGAPQQQREQLGAQLGDGAGVAVGLGQPRELVDLGVGLGGLVGRELRAEGGHAVLARLQERRPRSAWPPRGARPRRWRRVRAAVPGRGRAAGPPTDRPPRAAAAPRWTARGQEWCSRARRPARRPRDRSSSPAASAAKVAGSISRQAWARRCRWSAVPRPRLSTSASSPVKNSLTPSTADPGPSPAGAPRGPRLRVVVVGGQLGQPQDQLRLVGGVHRLPPLPPDQLRGHLLAGQQLHGQPRQVDRLVQRPVDEHTLHRGGAGDPRHSHTLCRRYDSFRRRHPVARPRWVRPLTSGPA